MQSLKEVTAKLENDDDDGSLSVATTAVDDEEINDLAVGEVNHIDDDQNNDELPLWYYQRQKSQQHHHQNRSTDTNIPYCTTSIMGKVILNSSTSVWTPASTTTSATAAATSINTVTGNQVLSTAALPSSTSTTNTTNSRDEIVTAEVAAAADNDGDVVREDEGDTSMMSNQNRNESPVLPQHTWYNQTIYIVVCGYSDGQVRVSEATTNAMIVDKSTTASTTNDTTFNTPTSSSTNASVLDDASRGSDIGWYVTTNPEKNSPIVSVSIDATGTVMTAIDTNGNCTIWTIKYSIQYEPEAQAQSPNQASSAQPPLPTSPKATATNTATSTSGNLLSKLFWRNTTSTTTPTTTTTTSEDTSTTTSHMDISRKRMVPTLTMVDVKVTRIQPYQDTIYGTPTGICLDPQFVTNFRFIVIFASGKIVVTSRNWMRRYEEHTILPYFNSVLPKETYIGIESIVWRSSIIAFADCSGISLYDMQSFKPIARVDRPIGAQPSLYSFLNPSTHNTDHDSNTSPDKILNRDENAVEPVARIKPHLYFETCRSLLVAWGDCLMTLSISDVTATVVEHQAAGLGTSSTSSARDGPTTSSNSISAVRKRTVACTMAWALDGIVAADVVPIDERHIAILGYVLGEDDEDELGDPHTAENSGSDANQRIITNLYEMELQIVDRTNGSISYSDLLQLQQPIGSPFTLQVKPNYNQYCRLLSSFAVPRMDDTLELKEEKGDTAADMVLNAPKFVDSHLRWSLNMVSFPASMSDENNHEVDIDDNGSVDSDEYDFLIRSTKHAKTESSVTSTVPPPTLIIVSNIDMVQARVRDVDDAIHFALEHHRPALALFWALKYRTRQLRRYTMDELINVYLRSLLRITAVNVSPIGKRSKQQTSALGTRKLSLRRMTLAAQSLPILLGGNVTMWKKWIIALEKIPGALFVVRKYIPVRDPKLPKSLYARVLSKMLEEVETMRNSLKPDVNDRLVIEAEGHFLSTVLAWGTSHCLKEHLKLFKYHAHIDNLHAIEVRRTIESLRFRYEQSAVGYLDPSSTTNTFEQPDVSDFHFVDTSNTVDVCDSLYNVDDVFALLAQRISIIRFNTLGNEEGSTGLLPMHASDSRVAIDGIAKIHMMNNSYDEALKCFLTLSAVYSSKSLDDVEQDALSMVNQSGVVIAKYDGTYSFVLHLVEIHHLHQYLLETSFLPDGMNCSPICALIRLVGLDLAGEFLIQNCTAPQHAIKMKADGERRGTLPLDLVADQLSGNPKLFHWYLHILSIHRPELYVKFPTTANPPPAIVTLHKKHLDLYIRYAGPNRDSTQVLENVEAYLVTEQTTPLLSFLKVILQLGTIGAIEVAKLLEIERRGGAGVSHIFALELAFILENYGNKTETDALLILELFLEGAQSLMLAVSFAQRTKTHSTKLWEKLIAHCLLKSAIEKTSDGSFSGMLFGSLLEAAALSGADLSHLVAQIPKGMQVEGLRPRLIAAVADYRLKLQLHSKSNEIAIVDKNALFIESSRRCRRGMRYENHSDMASNSSYEKIIPCIIVGQSDEVTLESPSVLSTQLRPRNRLNRYSHSLQIPIR